MGPFCALKYWHIDVNYNYPSKDNIPIVDRAGSIHDLVINFTGNYYRINHRISEYGDQFSSCSFVMFRTLLEWLVKGVKSIMVRVDVMNPHVKTPLRLTAFASSRIYHRSDVGLECYKNSNYTFYHVFEMRSLALRTFPKTYIHLYKHPSSPICTYQLPCSISSNLYLVYLTSSRLNYKTP